MKHVKVNYLELYIIMELVIRSKYVLSHNF